MSNYKLKIELLSDMCVSDGGVYNSVLDMDICYDAKGFPYIPSKRLKGCLRECAIEINEWGKDIAIDKLFGRKGESINRGLVRIGNANIEKYDELASEITQNTPIYHQQNILDAYTYIRTQTSLTSDGVADPSSLRTMRVVNKGVIFEADVELADDSLYNDFEMCVKTLTNMGLSRTRGLGEVKASLVKADKNSEKHEIVSANNTINYEITLLEPMICKSVNGGEGRTLDYIEGSKILGLILGEKVQDLSVDNIICSNAYIAEKGKRYTEVSANIYSIKNESSEYFDKLSGKATPLDANGNQKQLNMMKHTYCNIEEDGTLHKKSVLVETRYHHRRPEDKSIGRAMDEEGNDSTFYYMSSIAAGQSFRGTITGGSDQIKKICKLFSEKEIFYMGYSRSAEYGKVSVKIENGDVEPNKIECDDIVIKLLSPAIVYNDKAFYSTDAKDLIEEVKARLGITDEICDKCEKFINYVTVGGYNVTWNMRKPTIVAFDKGCVVHFKLNKKIVVDTNAIMFIGERINEGYGEIEVRAIDTNKIRDYIIAKDSQSECFVENITGKGDLTRSICDNLFKKYIKNTASINSKGYKVSEKDRATVSNMILMCNDCSSLDEIRKNIKLRYDKSLDSKKDKLERAEGIVKETEKACDSLIADFCNIYNIAGYSCEKDVYEITYLREYLIGLKYCIRREKKNEK